MTLEQGLNALNKLKNETSSNEHVTIYSENGRWDANTEKEAYNELKKDLKEWANGCKQEKEYNDFIEN